MPTDYEERNLRLTEELDAVDFQLDRERRHGPVNEDPSVEAELIPLSTRRRYAAMERWDG